MFSDDDDVLNNIDWGAVEADALQLQRRQASGLIEVGGHKSEEEKAGKEGKVSLSASPNRELLHVINAADEVQAVTMSLLPLFFMYCICMYVCMYMCKYMYI